MVSFQGRDVGPSDRAVVHKRVACHGSMERQVRYLCGWPAISGTNDGEVEKQMQASTSGWVVIGHMWSTAPTWVSTRLLMWKCLCRSTSLSGLEPLVLTKHREQKLERQHINQLRVLNLGEGNSTMN